MKIVIDARFFGTETGIGRYVKELVENLEKIDAENKYVVFLSAKNFDLYSPKNPNFIKKLADIRWYSLKEQLQMGRLIDAERADLAHFPHFNVPFFCRTPYVVTIHDLILRHYPTSAASTKNPVIFYLKYLFYRLILRRAIMKAKKIIAPSYFVKNDIIKNFKGLDSRLRGNDRRGGGNDRGGLANKIRVIYEDLSNLPQTDLGEEYLKAKNITSPYLLYIGNAYPHKNLERLIQAFAILHKDNSELQLVLVGKRNYFSKRLENYALRVTHYGLRDIIFYGYASDEELATLYKHASLYVFPSLMEGFGLPSLEALSSGLPSAVSDIPIFHEILGNAAFYFNRNDAGDMAAVIKNALQNAEARSKILEEGGRVLLRYSSSRHAREMKEVYYAAHGSVQRSRFFEIA